MATLRPVTLAFWFQYVGGLKSPCFQMNEHKQDTASGLWVHLRTSERLGDFLLPLQSSFHPPPSG